MKLHLLEDKAGIKFWRWIVVLVKAVLDLRLKSLYAAFIRPAQIKKAYKRASQIAGIDQYISVDPKGFLFCLEIFPAAEVIYYSLELYLMHEISLASEARDHAAELQRKNRIHGFIIQSGERQRLLLEEWDLPLDFPVFHLPVTYIGPAIHERTSYLRDRYGIPDDQRILLIIGGIVPDNNTFGIIKAFQSCKGVTLVIHGHSYGPYLQKIRAYLLAADVENVIISEEYFAHSDEVLKLVSSADMGLAWYEGFSSNMTTAGFSSGKIPLYYRCGLPVLANQYPSFKASVGDVGCGVCMSDLSSLPSALDQVWRKYSKFSENAFAEYEKRYRFELYETALDSFLNNFIPEVQNES